MTTSMQQWTATVVDGAQRTELGESPRFEPDSGLLSTVDILRGIVSFAEPAGDRVVEVRREELPTSVSAINPIRGGQGHLLAVGTGLALLELDGTTRDLITLEPVDGGTRTNEAVTDPSGRLWVGTMALDGARDGGWLYVVDTDGRWRRDVGPVSVSNGTAFSADERTMYYADSLAPAIVVREFDPDGTAGPPSPFATVTGGLADGFCRDDEGCLWVAVSGAGEVWRFSPDGEHVGTVTVPDAPLATACVLVGEQLYITTAHVGMSDAQRRAAPASGLLHVADVGVSGPSATPFGADRDVIVAWAATSSPTEGAP